MEEKITKLGIIKSVIIFSMSAIMLFNSTPITASASQENDRVIKSYVVDENGVPHIEYYDFDYLPVEDYSSKAGRANYNSKYGALNSLMSAAAAPSYNWSLSGAYNDYTLAMALSESTTLINYMYVSISGYMTAGTYVGRDEDYNEPGWLAGAMSASLTIAANPFNYQFGSALSQHVFRCDGYEQVSDSLSWRR